MPTLPAYVEYPAAGSASPPGTNPRVSAPLAVGVLARRITLPSSHWVTYASRSRIRGASRFRKSGLVRVDRGQRSPLPART